MGWIYLVLAGLSEIGFSASLKLSNNFTEMWPTIIFLILSVLSIVFLAFSLETIPMGTAYAIWMGIGAFGTALIGILFFSESTDFWRIFFLGSLILSLIGLKAVS